MNPLNPFPLLFFIGSFFLVQEANAETFLDIMQNCNKQISDARLKRNSLEAEKISTSATNYLSGKSTGINYEQKATDEEHLEVQRFAMQRMAVEYARGKRTFSLHATKDASDRYSAHMTVLALYHMAPLLLLNNKSVFLYKEQEIINAVYDQRLELLKSLKIDNAALKNSVTKRIEAYSKKALKTLLKTRVSSILHDYSKSYPEIKEQWVIQVADIRKEEASSQMEEVEPGVTIYKDHDKKPFAVSRPSPTSPRPQDILYKGQHYRPYQAFEEERQAEKLYRDGLRLMDQMKYKDAIKYFDPFAKGGEGIALHYMGLCHRHLKDDERAFWNFRKASEQGFSLSQEKIDEMDPFNVISLPPDIFSLLTSSLSLKDLLNLKVTSHKTNLLVDRLLTKTNFLTSKLGWVKTISFPRGIEDWTENMTLKFSYKTEEGFWQLDTSLEGKIEDSFENSKKAYFSRGKGKECKKETAGYRLHFLMNTQLHPSKTKKVVGIPDLICFTGKLLVLTTLNFNSDDIKYLKESPEAKLKNYLSYPQLFYFAAGFPLLSLDGDVDKMIHAQPIGSDLTPLLNNGPDVVYAPAPAKEKKLSTQTPKRRIATTDEMGDTHADTSDISYYDLLGFRIGVYNPNRGS